MWKPQQQHVFASIHSCGLVSIQLSISINMSRMLLVCTAGTHHKIFELQHLKFIAAVFPWCKTPNLYHYANMVINNNVIFRISCHKQIKFYPSSYNWKIFKGSQKSPSEEPGSRLWRRSHFTNTSCVNRYFVLERLPGQNPCWTMFWRFKGETCWQELLHWKMEMFRSNLPARLKYYI